MKNLMLLSAATAAVQYRSTSTFDMSHARVDREKGIIKGVSLISEGPVRIKNKQTADRTTLEQIMQYAQEFEGGLRVRFNPSTFDHGPAGLAARIPGDSLRIKGKQLLGDMHLYESYPHRDYIFEMAETAPDNFGLSLEFNGVPEEIGDQKFARCGEIFAATIVDIPAANATGLFRRDGDEDADGEINMDSKELTTLIKDVLKTEREEIVNQLRTELAAVGAPSTEELAAAGVTDKDTAEEKTKKVTEYRAIKDKPVTLHTLRTEMLQIFRMTGGKPAQISSAAEGAEGDATPGTFKAKVEAYENAGMKPGLALRRAAQDDPDGYNKHVEAEARANPEQPGKKKADAKK